MIYDVIIIGAGVTGSAVARELSRYNGNFLVLEKGEDVCSGTSKANSGIVHAGYDCKPGTMKARMNVRGNEMMTEICETLDIPFTRIGSLLVCTDPNNMDVLRKLYDQGISNGVKDMELISGDEARHLEPHLKENVCGALLAKTAGVICPFKLNIAMAENAFTNGVDFHFNTEVETIKFNKEENIFNLRTNNGEYKSHYIVNAAGVYADRFHNMVSAKKIHIVPRRGNYYLLDKNTGDYVSHVIFPTPTKFGKGVLVTPTVHGNTLVGPTAVDLPDNEKENTATTVFELAEVREKASDHFNDLPLRQVITSFAGLRAHEDGHDFILGPAADCPAFYDCAGIESPGLSSAPAIGEYMACMLRDDLKLTEKSEWIDRRRDILNPKDLSMEERNKLIKEHPEYGQIICRCESVTEGEIIDAIRRPLGARSLDGVKRRTRAGMGRCQSGFCSPRVMEIINRELGLPLTEITKSGGESKIVFERTKEG